MIPDDERLKLVGFHLRRGLELSWSEAMWLCELAERLSGAPAEFLHCEHFPEGRRVGVCEPCAGRNWTLERHTCPNCDHEGPVIPDFGTVIRRGKEQKQSYCGNCRRSINYHSKPRKYNVDQQSKRR